MPKRTIPGDNTTVGVTSTPGIAIKPVCRQQRGTKSNALTKANESLLDED